MQEGYTIKYFMGDVSKALLQSYYDVTSLDNELRLFTSPRWSERCESFPKDHF